MSHLWSVITPRKYQDLNNSRLPDDRLWDDGPWDLQSPHCSYSDRNTSRCGVSFCVSLSSVCVSLCLCSHSVSPWRHFFSSVGFFVSLCNQFVCLLACCVSYIIPLRSQLVSLRWRFVFVVILYILFSLIKLKQWFVWPHFLKHLAKDDMWM